MASDEIAHNFSPLLIIYKDGRIHWFMGNDRTPPSVDPQTGVISKDVVISTEPRVSAQIYKPKSIVVHNHKLPLLIYFHGGAFCIQSAFSPNYHRHLNSLVAKSNYIAVSVEYRLDPEHPLLIAYEDSWASVKWVDYRDRVYFAEIGPDEWITEIADLDRVYFARDSAGANIAHHVAVRVGVEGLAALNLRVLNWVVHLEA